MKTVTYSRDCTQCQNCKDRDVCNNKRKVAMNAMVPEFKMPQINIQINPTVVSDRSASEIAAAIVKNLRLAGCKI